MTMPTRPAWQQRWLDLQALWRARRLPAAGALAAALGKALPDWRLWWGRAMVVLVAVEAADRRPARVEITTSSATAPGPAGAAGACALSDDKVFLPSAPDSAPGWIPVVIIFIIARPKLSKCYYSTINIQDMQREFTGVFSPAMTFELMRQLFQPGVLSLCLSL